MDFIQGEARKQYIIFPGLLDDYITEDSPTRVIDAPHCGRVLDH